MEMNIRHDIEKYINDVNDIYNSGVPTEHTYRVPLVNLLTHLLSGNKKNKVGVYNEGTRKNYGAPDIEFRRDNVTIAFIRAELRGEHRGGRAGLHLRQHIP